MTNAMVLRPTSFDQLATFASMAAKSTMVPRDYIGKPENIMLAVQMGSEIGLAPMQAIQNIAVINGKPAVYGDALLAIVKAHPKFAGIQETMTGTGDEMIARCVVKRTGDTDTVATFSVSDAKAAGLWGKTGPWQQYPKRMLQMRARGFATRDAFPDALKGLISAEEAADIPVDTFKGATISHVQEPISGPAVSADDRSNINAAVPLSKKRTWMDVVADINTAALACTTEEEALALGDHDLVKKAYAQAGEDTKAEVERILGETYQRCIDIGSAAEPVGAGP